MEQIAILNKKDIHVEIIPGVSSVFASAAALGAELTIPELNTNGYFDKGRRKNPCSRMQKN